MKNFFAIEGTDGSGKATQTAMLQQRLVNEGCIKVSTISSPSYGRWYARFVEEYKKGSYGPMVEVDPYQAALCFAMCRWEEGLRVRNELALVGVDAVIADRWTASNEAHQGAKCLENGKIGYAFSGTFLPWLHDLEHEKLEIPKPQLYIILDVLPETSAQLMGGRKDLDGHESSLIYQQKVRQVYLHTAQIWPEQRKVIQCCREDGSILPKEEIHEKIWEVINGSLQKQAV